MFGSKHGGNHEALAGFILGSALSAATILISLAYLNKDGKEKARDAETKKALPPEEFREEQLSRNALYFGDGQSSITSSRVLVIGCGGVGSHAAMMLARSGVGHIRLVDFDQVTLSSLNRHACARLADVGLSKVSVLQSYIHDIAGEYCEVEAIAEMYTEDNSEELLSGDWDYVVDAIDDVSTKASLLIQCFRRNLTVISCMGAGGKADPTRLHIGELRTASRDPLAAKIRQRLKSAGVPPDWDGLRVVYSSEKLVMKLAQLSDEQKDSPHLYGAVDHMRVRVLPVLGTMPAIMGQTLASWVLCQIANKPFFPMAGERVGKNVRHKLFQHLRNREKKIYSQTINNPDQTTEPETIQIISGTWVGPLQIDKDDVEFLLMELWHNRCALTGARLGSVLELARWDLTQPSSCTNLVLMSTAAMEKFDREGTSGFDAAVVQRVEQRLKWVKEMGFQ